MQTVRVAATDGGTHLPEFYANNALVELVPVPPNATPDQQLRVATIRQILREPIVDLIMRARIHERNGLAALTDDEAALLAAVEGSRHHGSGWFDGININTFEKRVAPGRLLSHDTWITNGIDGVIAATRNIEPSWIGDMSSRGEMIDQIRNVVAKQIMSMQLVERATFVTQRIDIGTGQPKPGA